MEKILFSSENATYSVYRNQVKPGQPYTIFLHGGPGLNNFAERKLLGPYLNQHLNFLWFDLLGCHESPAKSDAVLTWDKQVDDIFSIVSRYAEGPVNIVSHCIGSQVGHSFVRKYPASVNKLVFISPNQQVPATFKGIISLAENEGRLKLSDTDKAQLQKFINLPDSDFVAEDVNTFLKFAMQAEGLFDLYWHNHKMQEKYFAETAQAPLNPTTFVAMQMDFFKEPAKDPLFYSTGLGGRIPILLLQGEHDRITPWQQNGKLLAENHSATQVEFIPEAAHWPHFENQQACLPKLVEFLS
jgi:pimeloyl-ACP methyl ester carboxylesterase